MKQTFKLGTTTYTASIRHGSDQVIARMKQMGLADPTVFDRWREVYDSITEDALMQARMEEIAELHVKASKSRKQSVRSDSRVYPRWGASASTADYVREYHLANANRYNHDSVKDWVKGFYQPLSKRVTVPQGEDSEELCLSGS